MRERLEYALVWPWIKLLGLLPRPVARALAIGIGLAVYRLHTRLRQVGMRNLTLAFPAMSDAERRRILRGVFVSLGRQLAEICLFPRYTRENVSDIVVYDGLENYERAMARGKGVLFLTGHLGAWELSAFAHSLQGHPLWIVMRPLDNPYLDRLVERYRTMHGNRTVSKDDFVRGLLAAMRASEAVGILMDTNMTPPQGVFVDFFGTPACTASGLARIALRTDAAVVPGFTIWDEKTQKYILRFDPALELIRTAAAAAASSHQVGDDPASTGSHVSQTQSAPPQSCHPERSRSGPGSPDRAVVAGWGEGPGSPDRAVVAGWGEGPEGRDGKSKDPYPTEPDRTQADRAQATEADIVANTALFTSIIESYVRRYPDQWLWVHRRWKTRPEGEKPLY